MWKKFGPSLLNSLDHLPLDQNPLQIKLDYAIKNNIIDKALNYSQNSSPIMDSFCVFSKIHKKTEKASGRPTVVSMHFFFFSQIISESHNGAHSL